MNRATALLALLATLTAASFVTDAAAAETNWLDVESRIQYSFYTEDQRSLRGVMELLATGESQDPTQNYYAGLANYRLSQLTARADQVRAKSAAQQCVSSLDAAVRARQDFADAMALQSACLDQLAGLEAWRAPFASSKSGTQMQKARHLAPANPRVLLLDAAQLYDRPKNTAVERARALSGFGSAAAAFEAERQDTEHIPGWGAAEAYIYLGKCYLETGQPLQARDALERALLIAPEFAEARRLMAKITTG